MIKQNDTIGIIALSGACDIEKVELAKNKLECLGYRIKLSKNIYDKNRYLAGTDESKIEELHSFFLDKEIKLILNARGGYGAIRLINQIDYDIIKNNPKPFCGFSDITALLLMIYKKTGLVTYHSPMACSDFATENNDFSIIHFFKALNNEPLEFQATKTYQKGDSEGILWGGNLATVVSLCGQDFFPKKDFIFFTEDLNEPVYKIDKMLQQLINIESFIKQCKGIVLGDFLDTDNETWLEEYFNELANRLEIPILGGFKITHNLDKITLPIGKKARIKENQLYIY